MNIRDKLDCIVDINDLKRQETGIDEDFIPESDIVPDEPTEAQ
jgi:hypothetical protein